MKPDKLDIKIQEAAAQHQVPFPEDAWNAMEKKLDEEMPQNKKNRKKFFWVLLILLMLAGGASWLILRNHPDKPVLSKNENTVHSDTENKTKENLIVQKKTGDTFINKDISSSSLISNTNKSSSIFRNFKKDAVLPGIQNSNNAETFAADAFHSIEMNKEIDTKNLNQQQNATALENMHQSLVSDSSNNEIKNVEKKVNDISVQTEETISKQNMETIDLKKPVAKKSSNKFSQSFSLQLSAGPDISFVNLKNIGKIQPVFGAGISYAINQKFSIRSGFYVTRKTYIADPSDYHPSTAGFWDYYPHLDFIDANCKIYEVPIIINYVFNITPSQQWFASAGVSSYFMKSEDYTYINKPGYTPPRNNNYQIKNENQHYVASLRFSAGFEKKLSNKISITAEPYFNLPLKGIGYGKVKLNSTGILFSVGIRPFDK